MDFIDFLQQQNNYIWALTALVSGGLLIAQALRERTGGASVGPAEATRLINHEDAVVLDVREHAEWERGHILGAKHVPVKQIENRLPDLAKYRDARVIVVCATGPRSNTACNALRKAGFGKVVALAGGLEAWQQAGLPLAKK